MRDERLLLVLADVHLWAASPPSCLSAPPAHPVELRARRGKCRFGPSPAGVKKRTRGLQATKGNANDWASRNTHIFASVRLATYLAQPARTPGSLPPFQTTACAPHHDSEHERPSRPGLLLQYEAFPETIIDRLSCQYRTCPPRPFHASSTSGVSGYKPRWRGWSHALRAGRPSLSRPPRPRRFGRCGSGCGNWRPAAAVEVQGELARALPHVVGRAWVGKKTAAWSKRAAGRVSRRAVRKPTPCR